MSKINIRKATVADAALILAFIQALADYEEEPDAVEATVADIETHLFDPNMTNAAMIAELDGQPAGIAIYYLTFSTWTGRPGLFLLDLFVYPKYRGHGLGKRLMIELAKMAVANDYARIEWEVLDWNKSAIDFYDAIGAKPKNEWIPYRLDRDAIEKLISE